MKTQSGDFAKSWYALCLLFVVLAVCGCGGGSSGAAPTDRPVNSYTYSVPETNGDGWQTESARELGISENLLERMMNALDSRFDIVDSIAIAYAGMLVLDETVRTVTGEFDERVGNTNPAIHVLFSASKSIASLAIGIAIDQGILSGIDAPYLELFPYESYANFDSRKAGIILEDVLTMRLGIEWDEWDPPYSSPDNRMLTFYEEEFDYSKALLDLPMASEPGTRFAYTTPATVSLGQAIENKGPLTLLDFGLNHVMQPLEISDVEVFSTPTGLPDLGRGLYFRTRDFLKFGQLYLDGGSWNSRRIVSESWVLESTIARTPLEWREPDRFDWQLTGYGYQWWTGYFEHDGERLETFAALGHGEQVLMVIPAMDLVVAVNSHAWNSEADEVNQVYALISEFILPAVPVPGS